MFLPSCGERALFTKATVIAGRDEVYAISHFFSQEQAENKSSKEKEENMWSIPCNQLKNVPWQSRVSCKNTDLVGRETLHVQREWGVSRASLRPGLGGWRWIKKRPMWVSSSEAKKKGSWNWYQSKWCFKCIRQNNFCYFSYFKGKKKKNPKTELP